MTYSPIRSIASVAINAGGQSWALSATVDNDRGLRVNNAAALRGFDGNPSTGINSFAYSIGARTVDLEVTAIGNGGVTALHNMCEAMLTHPGSATIEVGIAMDSASQADGGGGVMTGPTFWSQHVGLAKVELEKTTTVANTYKLSITLLDGSWTSSRTSTWLFSPNNATATTGLDFPHDMPFDLSVSANVVVLNGFRRGRQLWPTITVKGPCAVPAVMIAGNRYTVNESIPDNSTLTIDTANKTVTLEHGGLFENWLGKASLGMGEGSGSYIFQPLPEITDNATTSFTVSAPSDTTVRVSVIERITALNI